ncbi:MAG: YitT family protein [Bacillales bacterium]|nr:YitT family protein [Bacillales bacterium]
MSKDRNPKKISPVLKHIKEIANTVLGSAVIAVGFNVFLLPNQIAPGGVGGISTITKFLFDWEPALVQWGLGIPLLIAGAYFLGKDFGAKSILGTLLIPFFVYLTRSWNPVTHEPLLGAIFGGISVGIGLGIVFLGKASTGGTDTLAQIVHKYTGLSLGNCIALADGVVVILATLSFEVEKGLYAMISLYVISKTIDIVQVGLSRLKTVMVITNYENEIRKAITEKINRGITRFDARGGYTDTERPVLMVVISQTEYSRLKEVIYEVDPSAFMIVMDAAEVVGIGFKQD